MKKIIVLWLCAILFCSCDILLPRPISGSDEGDNQGYDESASTFNSDLTKDDADAVAALPDEVRSNSTKDEAEAMAFLTDFYKLYINWFMGGAPSSAYEACLSKDLLGAFEYFDKQFEETGYQVLDSDPFIKAQDLAGSLREGKFVIKKTDKANCYEMCYDDTSVKLYVIKQDGKYLIDDVEDETAGTVCRLMHNMLYSY